MLYICTVCRNIGHITALLYIYIAPSFNQQFHYIPIALLHYMLSPSLHVRICPPLDPLSSFGSYSLSLQEVAQRWQSRDTSSAGNDGENGQGSSEEEQSCPCDVRVSQN